MKVEEIKFRFVMPRWETRKENTVECIEPDLLKDVTRPLISRQIEIEDAHYLGYVRAEELLMADMMMAESDGHESFFERASTMIENGAAMPKFLSADCSDCWLFDETVALATYLVACECAKDHRGGYYECGDLNGYVDEVFSFYLRMPDIHSEWEYAESIDPQVRDRYAPDPKFHRKTLDAATEMRTLYARKKRCMATNHSDGSCHGQRPSTDSIMVTCGMVEETVADAVVNAANEHLAAGSGICGAIFRKAGYAPLRAACDKVAPCPTGEARITPAFGITNAKHVIHAVGPRWYGGGEGEPALLANCYRNLLKTAVDNGCRSVAIPSISTGIFGYPLDAAIAIAVREVKAFVAAHPDFKVIFVVWDGDADGGKSTQAKYLRALG